MKNLICRKSLGLANDFGKWSSNLHCFIAPDKNLRSLGKYAPFFCELGINIFNLVSQYITVLFHCVFQNFQLGILVS